MYNSKILKQSKFSIGGMSKMFVFLKNKNRNSRYRRKPTHLYINELSYELYYLILLNNRN